jgi:O-antigen ligase
MIRYTLLWLFVLGLMRYAWKDWCKSLCVLILMLAVLERPDMPKGIFGIQGLNPFNIALAGILAAWVARRDSSNDIKELPPWARRLFIAYVVVMLIATARMLLDPSYLIIFQRPDFGVNSRSGLIAEYLINTFKWLIPPILLVYGCRGRERQQWLVVCVLGMYAVLAYLVFKQMPLGLLADGDALQRRAVGVLQRRVGYHRVELATMFAGAAWAMLAARPLFEKPIIRAGLVGLSAFTTLGLALTGGRTGYAAWCIVGLTLAVLKWRRYLLGVPVAVAMVFIIAPGIPQRMLQGFGGADTVDQQVVLAGRNVLWPYVLDAIGDSPILGHGRQAWIRSNLRMQVVLDTGQNFGHPHNGYLEFALDNGLIGLAVILPFFAFVLWNAARMFRVRDDPFVAAIGGIALATTLAYVIGAAGAQSFYAHEGAVGMWCVVALALRVAQDAKAAAPATAPVSPLRPARPTWRRPAAPGGSRPARPARRPDAVVGYRGRR